MVNNQHGIRGQGHNASPLLGPHGKSTFPCVLMCLCWATRSVYALLLVYVCALYVLAPSWGHTVSGLFVIYVYACMSASPFLGPHGQSTPCCLCL